MIDLSYSTLKMIAYEQTIAGPRARLAAMVELERRERRGKVTPVLTMTGNKILDLGHNVL